MMAREPLASLSVIEPSGSAGSRNRLLAGLFVTLLISAVYVAGGLRRGWHAGDDGVLAQTAERVLQGELPQRDFDDVYTGGQSYIDAAAFRLWGTDLVSMRYAMFAFFLPWVVAFFFLSSRLVSPWAAAGFTLLAVAWGIPNNSTPMPSWYNMFFATFGVAALFRAIETNRRAWLFVAGLCGGISFLFKLSGLYFVAGAALFLLFRGAKPGGPISRASRWLVIVMGTGCVVAYEAIVLSLLRKPFYAGSFLYFFVPILLVGIAVVWRLCSPDAADDPIALTGNLLLFAAGVAIPILIFLIPYIASGAVGAFVQGVFILPAKRLSYTIRTQSLPRFLVGTAVDGMLIVLIAGTRRRLSIAVGILLIMAAVVVTLLARKQATVFDAAWLLVVNTIPAVVIAGIFLLKRKGNEIGVVQRQQAFLLLAVTAAFSLIQFPYSAPVYFCYVAPIFVLCMVAVGALVRDLPRGLLAGLVGVSLLFAALDVTPRLVMNRGEPDFVSRQATEIALPRALGLHLYGDDARQHAQLVNVISSHARGQYIYATPDCPEVYFLSGYRNPTRTLFDFLDDPSGRTQRILTSMQAHRVNLVVINLTPSFSDPPPPDLREALERNFPDHESVGHFEVRWKP
jgi:hypothetical protein